MVRIQSLTATAIFSVSAALSAFSSPASAVVITADRDVLAGRAAFLAAGVSTVQFDWLSVFPGGTTWTAGILPPQMPSLTTVSVTLPDTTVNTVTGTASPQALNFGNWLDAAGFNGAGGEAIPDLAINGVETFDLQFGSDHQSIGLAIASGIGNLPSEIDLTGASFLFTAFDAANNSIGSETFSLLSGAPDIAWLTITSPTPFRRLEITETGAASAADQYFSNILTSVEDVSDPANNIPGPSSLLLFGFSALSLVAYRRAAKRRVRR